MGNFQHGRARSRFRLTQAFRAQEVLKALPRAGIGSSEARAGEC